MDNDQFAQFMAMKTDIASMKTALDNIDHTLSGNGSPGLVQTVTEQGRDIAFCKGGLALLGLFILTFGGVVLVHLWSGK